MFFSLKGKGKRKSSISEKENGRVQISAYYFCANTNVFMFVEYLYFLLGWCLCVATDNLIIDK